MRGVIVVVCSYSAQAPTFGGYACADNCSGHAAGYRWAEQYRITDMDECRGRSQFFYEGCLVYAEDPHRGAEEDDNGNPID